MHQLDNLQKEHRATTHGVLWSVALLHVLQVVQVCTDLQYEVRWTLQGRVLCRGQELGPALWLGLSHFILLRRLHL